MSSASEPGTCTPCTSRAPDDETSIDERHSMYDRGAAMKGNIDVFLAQHAELQKAYDHKCIEADRNKTKLAEIMKAHEELQHTAKLPSLRPLLEIKKAVNGLRQAIKVLQDISDSTLVELDTQDVPSYALYWCIDQGVASMAAHICDFSVDLAMALAIISSIEPYTFLQPDTPLNRALTSLNREAQLMHKEKPTPAQKHVSEAAPIDMSNYCTTSKLTSRVADVDDCICEVVRLLEENNLLA